MARKGNGIGNPSLFRLVAVTGFALFLAWFYILVASELTASAGFPHPTMRHIAIVLGLVLEMVVVSLFTDRFFRFRYRLMPAATLSGPLAIGLTCVFALPQPAFPLFYAIAGFTLGLQASIWGQFSEVLHDGPNDTLMIAGCIIAIAYVANAAFYRSEFQMTIGLFAPIASITLYLLAIRSPLLPANARTAARDAAKQAADECREQKMKEKKRGGAARGPRLASRRSKIVLFAYHFAIDLNFGLSIAWFIDSPAARNATGLILALSLLFSLALLLASEKMGIGMNEKVILFVLLASILCITALLALPNHAAWIAWSVLFSVCVLGRANNLRSGGRSTAQNKLNGMFVAASHRLVSGVAILVGLVYGAAFGFDETATNAILVVVSLVSVACTAAILLHTRNMEIDLSNEEAIKKLVGIVAEQYDLTAREKEIVFYLAQNIGGNELAEKLYLSPHTVKAHTANIYKKLSVHSRNELISLVLDIEKA